jgi:hypothetical protein
MMKTAVNSTTTQKDEDYFTTNRRVICLKSPENSDSSAEEMEE